MSTNPTTPRELINPAQVPAAELTVVNAPLRRREALLAASAKVSRLLLEAPEPMRVMHEALRLLGEAAEVDRTTLALAEVGPEDERWLVIKSEWLAEGVAPSECDSAMPAWGERKSDCFCPQLKAGRTVFVRRDDTDSARSFSIAGDRAKSSVIVPILVDGEYTGAIGFDDCHEPREFGSAVVSALEIAAGIVGAALHRERLMETMRRERELAAEQRLAQLSRANAALRTNLEELARNPDVKSFMGHMLLEATRQLDAAAASVVVHDETADEWRVVAYVEEGRIAEPPFAAAVPTATLNINEMLDRAREPILVDLAPYEQIRWPGVAQWHREKGHACACKVSMVFGDRYLGFIAVVLTRREDLSPERSEMLMALAQQATLAIGLKRLGYAAKNAAVLAERNRISQEIHDGLAQGFTGILMQLGAAEEHLGCARRTPLPDILNRIRALARDGLDEARRSVLALKPDQARVGGLELALRQLAEHSTIAGRITCTFDGGITSSGPAPEHQHELLRIAQEAVINAVRHAHSKHIRIVLIEESEHWILMVIDNGQGMENVPELYAQQGFGLANMRERARAIGGQFEIQSRVGLGTQVIVSLPRPKSR
jgi:signal transduction histidine kinase